jgi:8-oxo-dGTP pyrophosphatase MutT (NUDIX family)
MYPITNAIRTTRTIILRYNPNSKKVEIYLQKKKNGTVELPGGKVDDTNDQIEFENSAAGLCTNSASATRETLEETGLNLNKKLEQLGFFSYTNPKNKKITEVDLYSVVVDYKESLSADYRKALAEDNLIAGGWVSIDYFLRILETGQTSFYSLGPLGISDEISGNTMILKNAIEKIKQLKKEILCNPEIVDLNDLKAREARLGSIQQEPLEVRRKMEFERIKRELSFR